MGPDPTLRLGAKGPAVQELQALLNKAVAPPPELKADGNFGKNTKRIVEKFQSQSRLTIDGVVGPETWSKLRKKARTTPAPKSVPRPVAPGGPLPYDTDPTGLLPAAGAAQKLSDADFEKAAVDLGVETASIRAVAQIESGGRSGFDARGRPKILFEARYFHRLTKGAYDKTHPHLSQATWQGAKKYYKGDQWARMYEAMTLDHLAAWESASWGMFQVMGDNHAMVGWASIDSFMTDMFKSEYMHLKAFLGFCKSAGLVRYLKAKNWAKFAAGYNGPGYADNQYDTKMAAAYEKLTAAHK